MTDTAQPNGAAPTAEATPSAPEAQSSEQMVKDIMEFDPFGPPSPAEGEQTNTGTTEGKPDEPAGEGTPAASQEPTPPEPKAAQPAPATPTQQGLTQREQELTAQVNALRQAIQSMQQPKPEGQQPQSGQPQARYNLGLPPQLIAGLRSENEEEFAVAMHAVVNGIANRLWNDTQDFISKQVIPTIDQRASAVVSHGEQVRQVHTDFYGTYPQLRQPMLVPVVQNAALQVGQAWAAQGRPIEWNKDFADQVAGLVFQLVPHLAPQAQQQPTPAAPARPAPFVAGMGARPPAPKGNEFADIL